jgi:hypothetical protein
MDFLLIITIKIRPKPVPIKLKAKNRVYTEKLQLIFTSLLHVTNLFVRVNIFRPSNGSSSVCLFMLEVVGSR